MEVLLFLVLFLAMTGHSSATYCICKDGVSEAVMQKAIDYACGHGADCSPILQSGGCYNPNTIKDHCNFAVNSYFQKMGQASGTCDFSGTATTSATIPTQSSGCVYQATPSNSSTTPSAPAPSSTTPSTTPSSSTTPSTTPSSTTPSSFGLSPTGSGLGNTDSAADRILLQNTNLIFPLAFTATILWFSGLLILWG